jgi:hypothetical protein
MIKKIILLLSVLVSLGFASTAQTLENYMDKRDTTIVDVRVEENATVVTYSVVYPCWE